MTARRACSTSTPSLASSRDTSTKWVPMECVTCQGVTFFEDTSGFGLVNTLNILANSANYTHNPIECSEVRAI